MERRLARGNRWFDAIINGYGLGIDLNARFTRPQVFHAWHYWTCGIVTLYWPL